MHIVVAGAGDLGTYLVQKLTDELHAVSVVDTDPIKLDELAARYDVSTFRGNILSYDNMHAIGVPDANLFVAVTPREELNLMAAILAKRVGAQHVIARVRHSKLIQHDDAFDFKGLGIDEIISPDALAADEIELLLDRPMFSDLIEFEHGRYYIAGLPVSDHDAFVNNTLRSIAESHGKGIFTPVALVRGGATHLVAEDVQAQPGDYVYLITKYEGLATLAKLVHDARKHTRRALILGGSRAGIESARRLQDKKFQVTLVDRDRTWAEDLADYLPDVLVVNGNAQEPGFLEEHDITDMEAIIAATGDPEVNIIACLYAKKHGVRHTVALVKDAHYLHAAHEFGVDTLINKKLIAADFIVRHVSKDNVLSVASIPGLAMETIEFVVKEGSNIVDRPLSSLPLTRETRLIIGAVLRNNKPLELSDTVVLQPGDKVIAACHHAVRREFQELL
jgi:trk system potassium uptake protein TrkA